MTRIARSMLPALSLAALAPLGHAADLNTLQVLTQPQFRLLAEDLGAVVSFKPMIPAESMGLTGFDLGVAVTGTQLEHRDVWRAAAGGGDIPSTLAVPTLRIHKGLPFDIDVGASFSAVPSTNIRMTAAELRWAALPGSTLMPALAVRASVSALSGVDQLKLRTTGLDISVSKGFAMLTPYAGVGAVRTTATPDASTLKTKESFTLSKVFAGVNLNLGVINLAVEADKTGDASSYGVKMGWRF